MSSRIIPKTQLPWTQAFQLLQQRYDNSTEQNPVRPYDDFFEEIPKRPIVAWFSKKRPVICQLHKLTDISGDDRWIITGYNQVIEQTVTITNNPLPLTDALKYLSDSNEWVMCEFVSLYEFGLDILRYLEK